MKPPNLTGRIAILDTHVANSTAKLDPIGLSRSYDVPLAKVIEILKARGKYNE